MQILRYRTKSGKIIKFDDFVTEGNGKYWVEMCESCMNKHKEDFDTKYSPSTSTSACSVSYCQNPAEYYVDFTDGEAVIWRSGVHEYIHDMTREENAWVNVKELVERFVEMDNHFNNEPWTLEQILANINVFIPEKMPETIKYDEI